MSRPPKKLEEALLHALAGGTDGKNGNVLTGTSPKGFHMMAKPSPEFTALVQEHSGRLQALLYKPVLLAITWEDEASHALVRIVLADRKDHWDEKFESFTLPFPGKGLPPFPAHLFTRH